ncbi:MAG: transcription-repair coupling factor [Desulfofustis sp.]|nr:transcription-repair coupling factor [Desulfofustis sp.]
MDRSSLSYLKESATPVGGLRGSSVSWFCATHRRDRPACCILPDEQQAASFEQDLQLFSTREILAFPGYEIPPYTPLSPDQRTTAARLSTLYHLTAQAEPFILVVSIEALLRRVMAVSALQQHAQLLMEGEECDLRALQTSLVAMGYEHVSLVKSFGDFSVRGGVVDIYPPPFRLPDNTLHDGPIRLDFFADFIETIKPFDPFSQRSSGRCEEAVILPVSDILLPAGDRPTCTGLSRTLLSYAEERNWSADKSNELADRVRNGQRFAGIEFFLPLFGGADKSSTLIDYLPERSCLYFVEADAISSQMRLVHERIEANYRDSVEARTPCLTPEELFVSPDQLKASLDPFDQYAITEFLSDSETAVTIRSSNHQLLKQEISFSRKQHGLLKILATQMNSWLEHGHRILICCRSAQRRKNLAELLGRFGFRFALLDSPIDLDNLPDRGDQDHIFLCELPLDAGFSLENERVHLISESELFGERRIGYKKRSGKALGEPLNYTELRRGDVVVHREHGLGMYQGLETISLQQITNDYLLIEYRDGDKLYIPVDRLNQVSRYEGLSDKQPKIDKLGSQSFAATKQKVSDEVWKVAQELLDIYARREIRSGRSFSAPGEFYRELEESFPYDETPGQYQAINETIDDLIRERPMDRLICGDVGYGKTEVAIRAAFKVVEDSCQVAILVPTTVLAEQHVKTFRERLKDFPVTIACINRFRTPKEQRQIVAGLADGSIDIVIGTHRLLSRDIAYHNLGLLIIDEEHRFGVAHKEKIKRIKAEVDVLTLTATPIPRTLQLSLLGIRDLSVISTPPEHRRPVKTFVARYDDLVIKEAVNRELIRGGQVFVVHNRVRSIHRMAAEIQRLAPQARVAVAHGQMGGKELEDIMVAFVNNRIDVLVSTTIIESGLDIPSANTIIINRADRLGLAEIYQLRGRVGRSSTQSFAYLLVPSIDHLSKDSRERLKALMEYNELGGGFKLAMSDLQIRGGGNLLGVSQSGHIAAIGYDLYLDLLQKTVADLKTQNDPTARSRGSDLDPEINLNLSAYIPESYIADIGQRYIMYRRLAGLTACDDGSSADLKEELEDRYGSMPAEVHNLFDVVAIKKALIPLRISKLERGPDNLVFSFMSDTPVQPDLLMGRLNTASNGRRLTPDGRLIVSTEPASASLYETVSAIIEDLKQLTDAGSA